MKWFIFYLWQIRNGLLQDFKHRKFIQELFGFMDDMTDGFKGIEHIEENDVKLYKLDLNELIWKIGFWIHKFNNLDPEGRKIRVVYFYNSDCVTVTLEGFDDSAFNNLEAIMCYSSSLKEHEPDFAMKRLDDKILVHVMISGRRTRLWSSLVHQYLEV